MHCGIIFRVVSLEKGVKKVMYSEISYYIQHLLKNCSRTRLYSFYPTTDVGIITNGEVTAKTFYPFKHSGPLITKVTAYALI